MKRKRHMKLPNGKGSIKYLGKGRRRPYGVYEPVTAFTLEGVPVSPKAIGYAEDWYKAYDLLQAWHQARAGNPSAAMAAPVGNVAADQGPTFGEVYERYMVDKYEDDKRRKLSRNTYLANVAAMKHCSAVLDRPIASLSYTDLQNLIDNTPGGLSNKSRVRALIRGVWSYAKKYELVEKDYRNDLEVKAPKSEKKRNPYTLEQLKILWTHRDDPTAEGILIMCYTGFRINEWKGMEFNRELWYFRGGEKTEAGRDRIVPIIPGIRPLVDARFSRYGGKFFSGSSHTFRQRSYEKLEELGLPRRCPHECRHTFSMLCEHFKVSENDRKRLLGHAFADVTNSVYGHRSLDDLREEIEKIHVCC